MKTDFRSCSLGDIYDFASGLSKARSEFGAGHPFWGFKDVFYNSAVPKELDESALIDGCSYFQTFRHIIMPVMWPGVITAGLFSLMLAYNDFTVTALLLNQENHTMVPKIQSYLGTNQHEGNLMWAVSSVVSATAPLFLLIMFFQKQVISGLTAGAVKG